VGLRDCGPYVIGSRECRWSDQSGEVHLCAPESDNVLLLDEESAEDQSRAHECTCRYQISQTKWPSVAGPRECWWSDQSGEVHLCVPESDSVLLLDEESAGDQNRAKECTC
jgi:hypothetical protein